jgi:hypothetical protein
MLLLLLTWRCWSMLLLARVQIKRIVKWLMRCFFAASGASPRFVEPSKLKPPPSRHAPRHRPLTLGWWGLTRAQSGLRSRWTK